MSQEVRHKQVIKTSQEWEESTYILQNGELGYASDIKIIKVGNGVDPWINLPNVNSEIIYDSTNKRLILQ